MKAENPVRVVGLLVARVTPSTTTGNTSGSIDFRMGEEEEGQ